MLFEGDEEAAAEETRERRTSFGSKNIIWSPHFSPSLSLPLSPSLPSLFSRWVSFIPSFPSLPALGEAHKAKETRPAGETLNQKGGSIFCSLSASHPFLLSLSLLSSSSLLPVGQTRQVILPLFTSRRNLSSWLQRGERNRICSIGHKMGSEDKLFRTRYILPLMLINMSSSSFRILYSRVKWRVIGKEENEFLWSNEQETQKYSFFSVSLIFGSFITLSMIVPKIWMERKGMSC